MLESTVKKWKPALRLVCAAVLLMVLPVFLQFGCASSKSGKKKDEKRKIAVEELQPEPKQESEPSAETDQTARKTDVAAADDVRQERERSDEQEPAPPRKEKPQTAHRPGRDRTKAAGGAAIRNQTEVAVNVSTAGRGSERMQFVTRRATPWEVFYYRFAGISRPQAWKLFFSRGWESASALFKKLLPFLDNSIDEAPSDGSPAESGVA